MGLAVTYINLGLQDKARTEAEEILRIDPNFSVDYFEKIYPHTNPDYVKDYTGNLRKAGLK